ncbi:MAG: Cof-type HAD-IIB family hydrolase [Spirochaetaceae bacterium]|jgi:Cof subfamily protein (haloacid dehalogenase superfamily)|nr:Cof-type HAD-IIB family hydrolase [Spirochaetaceae bacterium]
MIKLISLDLDGTLLLADHVTVSSENITALSQAAEHGIMVCIATGRTYSVIQDVLAQLPCVRYCIVSNGAAIVDVITNEIIYRSLIPEVQSGGIAHILQSYTPSEIVCTIFYEGRAYLSSSMLPEFHRALGIGKFADAILRGITPIDDIADFCKGKSVEKFTLDYIQKDIRQEFINKVNTLGEFTRSSSFAENLEINALGTTKGKALRYLSGLLHIQADETAAFGDSDNDIEMLQWAGFSYAMENALPSVKEAARYTAPTNTESGVGKVIGAYLRSEP